MTEPTVIESQKDSGEGGIFSGLEPLGRVSMDYFFRLLDAVAQRRGSKARVSYDTAINRLRLSGESEHAGDRVQRVRVLYFSLTLHTFAWMIAAMYAAFGSGQFATTSLGSAMASLLLALVSAGAGAMAMAGIEAVMRCEIIDHTTEPSPEFDDLTQQYVNGEIDTEELEAETEARIES